MSQRSFRTRIRHSIADQNLQLALDNNARRRKESRQAAFAALPDHPLRRQRAHDIKAQVIAHLDEYLEKFISQATAHGIQVHQAATASEALAIFFEIVDQVPARGSQKLVAKAKSMVSEEINLNHAITARGMRVVETDLGEYIVQLRDERPSHIITPAVHLRRSDVGRLFAEKLGIPYTEDIPTLTNTARQVLRQVFLEADIGVSGVNFGIAETGTLAIVTNEGNGRMVTTLPPVHIALMGLERLLPTLDDLALFLSLLPRSATGQKLSVYTSLIHSPGPGQQRHLILVDNGRRALRSSPLAESLACIRCGACLNICPVFRELGGHAYNSIYPGPIGSVISCALVGPQFASLAQASSLCGACREVCPVDIDLPGMLLRIRAGQTGPALPLRPGVGLPAIVRLGVSGFGLAARHAPLFATLQKLGGLFSRLYSPRRAYMRLPAFTGWGFSKDFPRLTSRPFRSRWQEIEQNLPEPARPLPAQPTNPPQPPAPPATEDLVAHFTAEFTALGGTLHPVTATDLPRHLTAFLKEKNIDQICADEAGARYLPNFPILPGAHPHLPAGLTAALAAVAETGSLLLVAGPGQTLGVSLLPPIHLAILTTSQILPTVDAALSLPHLRQAPAGVLITGPSRTADIEMTLTIGVHGPGEIHVFLIDDSSTV